MSVGVADGVLLDSAGVELASCELSSSPPRGVGVRTAEEIGAGDRVSVSVGLLPHSPKRKTFHLLQRPPYLYPRHPTPLAG